MANNYIAINPSVRLGNALLSAATTLGTAKVMLEAMKRDMEQMIDGTDYTQVETSFGLAAGKGAPAYNIVSGTVAALQASGDLNNLLDYLATVR